MLTLDNPDKNNIIRLVSILRRHPKKASPPEGSAAGLLFLVKYTDDTDLQNTIRQLKESVSNTTINMAYYDQDRLFPGHVYENVRNNIKYFLIVYAATIITYLGTSVKSAMDSHTEFQYASMVTYALITALFPAVTALIAREKKALNQLEQT